MEATTTRLDGNAGRMMPGYTGFIPGMQHEFAATYGQATLRAGTEDLPSDTRNPDKWKKFTLPFEQYTKRVPYESYHIPGYGGYIQGMKAENVYGKTYGHTTFDIKHEHYSKGPRPVADERFRTTISTDFKDPFKVQHHPPNISATEKQFDNPDKPILIAECTRRRDPHSLKVESNMEPGDYHMPGYTGFTPHVTSENIHGATYASATRKSIRSRTLPPVRAGSSGIQSNEAQYPEDRIPGYSIPGYSGFVAAVKADNIFSHTYSDCTRLAKTVPHVREELDRIHDNPYPQRPPPSVLCDERPHFREKEKVPLKPYVKGSRNKSSGWMDERQHCGPELFKSTVNEHFNTPTGPPPTTFGKCPVPRIVNWPNKYPNYTPN